LKKTPIKLVEADAINWLKKYHGEKFDMIIDNLFIEKDGESVLVVKANHKWFAMMLKHLVQDSVIVRNFINKEELLKSAGLAHASTRKKLDSIFQFNNCLNESFVAAYLKKNSDEQAIA